jgi:hypothetical protein
MIWFTKYTMKNIISSKHHFSFVHWTDFCVPDVLNVLSEFLADMLSETSIKFLVCEFRDSILALGNAFSCPCYGNLESSVGSYMYIVAIVYFFFLVLGWNQTLFIVFFCLQFSTLHYFLARLNLLQSCCPSSCGGKPQSCCWGAAEEILIQEDEVL